VRSAAALFGVGWLALILFTLFYNGLAGLRCRSSPRTRRRPARPTAACSTPSSAAIIMTVIGVGIGAPLGMFAGTYLAEYGRTTGSPR
jgi:phosphate transport system permease protein